MKGIVAEHQVQIPGKSALSVCEQRNSLRLKFDKTESADVHQCSHVFTPSVYNVHNISGFTYHSSKLCELRY